MKKFYRASLDGAKGLADTQATTPSGSWKLLEAKMDNSRDSLRARGWRVNLVIDLEESDAAVAIGVAEQFAPKPVKGIIGFLKGLFG